MSEAVLKHAWDRVLIAVIQGAKPEDGGRAGDENSALHFALIDDRVDVADALIRLGANPTYVNRGPRLDGLTPLHVAAIYDVVGAIPLLLKHGVSIDFPDNYKKTPLIVAAEYKNSKFVEHLLKHGADPNAAAEDGQTALHRAVRSDDLDSIRALIKEGADGRMADSHGKTPLDLAREKGNNAAIILLTKQPPSLDRPSSTARR